MKKPKRPTPAEKRRSLRAAAMPAIRALVRKYGRATVANCIGQIREQEKAVKRVSDLKKEIARLRKAI